jgi:hypothetical protein
MIKGFYVFDENNRLMPGEKQTVNLALKFTFRGD